jgi:deoxyribodipyrimidine photo-lyase
VYGRGAGHLQGGLGRTLRMGSTAIVWYRRDLRVHDHPALHTAVAEHDRVVPVFVLDARLLHGRGAASGPRTQFMLGCLRALDAELRDRGGALVVREGAPERVLADLAQEIEADAVLWTSDVAPYARARDTRVTETLRALGAEPRPQPGNYVADVGRPRTKSGEPFSVFSPFLRVWATLPRRAVLPAPERVTLPAGIEPGQVPPIDVLGVAGQVPDPIVVPGEPAARKALARWLDGPIAAYGERHDDLTGGTSVLSPYLRWGCLSPRETEAGVAALMDDTTHAMRWPKTGPGAFRRQLAWRDFYAHVLLANPGNMREAFQERYRDLEYAEDPASFEAWAAGRTGYPLVDAAMRQLAATGWMHNRARLVVGSFLTKDLHLDHRLGEAHFARLLLDGEPAQNNGNWQWVASVGVDPAPYFRRLFNPTLQQRKFDPRGDYVRRWVPELTRVPTDCLFEPWTMTAEQQRAAGCVIGRDYPAPIVDHARERRRTIERFRAVAEAA